MNIPIALAATAACAALLACGPAADYAEPNAERLEAARELHPDADPVSAAARRDLPVALVVRLSISGTAVELKDVKLRSLARRPPDADRTAEHIFVQAVDLHGETVGSVAVPDTRINIAEGEGIIELEDRTVSVAIPLTRRPWMLEVSLPGIAPESVASIDVTDGVDAQCRKYPKVGICQSPLEAVR